MAKVINERSHRGWCDVTACMHLWFLTQGYGGVFYLADSGTSITLYSSATFGGSGTNAGNTANVRESTHYY